MVNPFWNDDIIMYNLSRQNSGFPHVQFFHRVGEREGERQNILGLKAEFGERSVFYDSY